MKKEVDDTPVKKIDDVKPKIKKEKNGTQVQVKKEKTEEKKKWIRNILSSLMEKNDLWDLLLKKTKENKQ